MALTYAVYKLTTTVSTRTFARTSYTCSTRIIRTYKLPRNSRINEWVDKIIIHNNIQCVVAVAYLCVRLKRPYTFLGGPSVLFCSVAQLDESQKSIRNCNCITFVVVVVVFTRKTIQTGGQGSFPPLQKYNRSHSVRRKMFIDVFRLQVLYAGRREKSISFYSPSFCSARRVCS